MSLQLGLYLAGVCASSAGIAVCAFSIFIARKADRILLTIIGLNAMLLTHTIYRIHGLF